MGGCASKKGRDLRMIGPSLQRWLEGRSVGDNSELALVCRMFEQSFERSRFSAVSALDGIQCPGDARRGSLLT